MKFLKKKPFAAAAKHAETAAAEHAAACAAFLLAAEASAGFAELASAGGGFLDNRGSGCYDILKSFWRTFGGKGQDLNIRYYWKNYPVFTIILVALNGLLFLGPDLLGLPSDLSSVLEAGGLMLRDVENGEIYRLLTAAFLHFDIQHLMSNMLVLAVMGYRLERIIGHIPFLILYLVSGIGANLISFFSYYVNEEYFVISAGASGAIFGVCGGMFSVALAGREAEGITAQQMLLWIVLTLLSGYMSAEVNNLAHLSGLLFGLVLGMASYLLARRRRPRNPWG